MVKSLKELYTDRFHTSLKPCESALQSDLQKALSGLPNIDRIVTRAKSVESFCTKALKEEDGRRKYEDPLNQVQDQLGARVIVFYTSDVEVVCTRVTEYYRQIESKAIVPDSESEFGYFGKHFILKIPKEVGASGDIKFFELQIKTLFQHSWAEANHDIFYKSRIKLSQTQKRKVAFTAAQAWGADQIFNDLNNEINKL